MSLIDELLATAPILTDGAFGTQLQARGLPIGDLPDHWNLTHPEAVEDVIRGYVEAGSEVVLSPTFRSNPIALEGHGLAGETAAINRAALAIARRAAAGKARVFASVGPSGKMLMSGDVTETELRAAFSAQVRALADAGADALLLETFSDLEEAKIAVAAARETGLPVGCSMVFDAGKNKDRTMMGATPERVAAELEEAGVDFLGANCGVGMEAYIPVCRRLRAASSKPLWIKPNAGLPEMEDGKAVYRVTPAQFAAQVPDLVAAGANFVGGCCGTSPDFIRATAAVIASMKRG